MWTNEQRIAISQYLTNVCMALPIDIAQAGCRYQAVSSWCRAKITNHTKQTIAWTYMFTLVHCYKMVTTWFLLNTVLLSLAILISSYTLPSHHSICHWMNSKANYQSSNVFTITDHLLQLLKLSAVLKTFCQSLSTIITNAVTIKTVCEQMYKEHSQVIRFCDVCASLVCILVISLTEDRKGEPIFNTTNTVSSKWLNVS